METEDKFKNSPIHDKRAILEMMDKLEPKEMLKVVDCLQEQVRLFCQPDVVCKTTHNMETLKDKMLEAIFVKTGGRPENPKIAEICAQIAEEESARSKTQNKNSHPPRAVVKAVFKGQDGSLGYIKNKEYLLALWSDKEIRIEMYKDATAKCSYSSIHSFLENWDCIRNV